MTAAPPPPGISRSSALRPAPASGMPDLAGRAPVIVLATSYSGAARLRPVLERVPDLAFTSGTGILPLCEQSLTAWRNADGRPGRPSALAVSSTRAIAGAIITAVLAREGKRRWCETCTAMPEAAEAFLGLYPAARFVCLYRSCAGFIRAVLDNSPWGITDPTFAPFTKTHPASTAAALAAYWAAHTGSLLTFEQSHPREVLRVRFEDLAAAGQDTALAVTSFLTAGSPADGWARPEPCTPGAGEGHPDGPETELPIGLIPSALLARVNDLLGQLGYPDLSG